jgi:hypothetical protein
MDKPFYSFPGIGSIDALARSLDVNPDLLLDIAKKVDQSYTSFDIPKKNGEGDRTVAEPKHELKRLQKKINSRILELVSYPYYLQGGIKDKVDSRDYVNNASIHVKPLVLVNLDIKNFYPNIHRDLVFNVFKNFFGFEPGVAEVLTCLTTLNGRVPQGGCCSSYLANLIFYSEEFKLVQKLRKKGWRYSRLLDDITISSESAIDDHISPIKEIASLCKKFGLKLNNNKTDVNHRAQGIGKLAVTGVWIGHGVAKLKKDERRYIRQLVYACEQKFKAAPNSAEYHDFWNKVSGKVAKMTRMDHVEAVGYRTRLRAILPTFDEYERNGLIKEVKTICAKPNSLSQRIGFIRRINRAHHALGILGRTERRLAVSLRKELLARHGIMPTLKEYWD